MLKPKACSLMSRWSCTSIYQISVSLTSSFLGPAMSKPAIINELPSEILLDIFEHLRNSSSNGLLAKAMLCCRIWHRLIASVLYSHVAVDSKLHSDSVSSRFTKQFSYGFLVKSFSLRICQVHLLGFNIASPEAYERLCEIRDIFPRLENLYSFSLSLEEQAGQGFFIPKAAVVQIIDSLPRAVVKLNLDIGSLDNTSQSHVCYSVSQVIPRLHCLRLRLSHICPVLFSCLENPAQWSRSHDCNVHEVEFPQATFISELRYAVIRLDTRPDSVHGTNSRLCHSGIDTMQAVDLATSLQRLHNSGAFPFLRRFAVIDRVDATKSIQNDHWNVFKIRDIIGNATITFPWCPRGGSSSLFMIRDMRGRDWFGTFNDVANSVDGPLSWAETGARSRTLRPGSLNLDGIWNLNTDELFSRQAVMDRFGVAFRLWKHEDATGMSLLHVRTASGFVDTEAVSEELPAGWRWVPEGRWQWTIQER
ncbi:hypothetical protein K469DRAFT_670666 [Zopfia rhizophila CBS 207.26]|uniref:F-box domain-containing protein n=1 Tax=Zopfia rhizophila CBS 207.26 TaxID=1314779 RepID=A0A6A6DPV8_9PEZI|nr:hypothetical protein K469DRAFT_670666 [Zopfia rhizophila CBS 207.26]